MTETNFDTGRNVPARPNTAQTVAELDGSAPLVGLDEQLVSREYSRLISLLLELESDANYCPRYGAEIEQLHYLIADNHPLPVAARSREAGK